MKSRGLILAIDQGTTGTTALIFNSNINILAKHNIEFNQHYPKPGWVEHDLDDIWRTVLESIRVALQKSGTEAGEISAIAITNQRETTCVWERGSGRPVGRAIVWQDRRTADMCTSLKKKGYERAIKSKTGLLLDPYFSGTKLAWMLGAGGLQPKAKAGKLAFGTIDSFILYKLTGEHKTEASNACRTLLMNLKTCQWDEELLKIFKIPKELLPEIHPSAVEYGRTRGVNSLPDGIPVTGMAGDQQAALFGQACFKPGMAKATYGTGAFILANTGDKPIFSKHRLLTSVAWNINDKPTYCIEGSAFIAGAAVQWLRDGLKFFKSASEIESMATEDPGAGGLMFVPALSGMGAPHWLANATGLITGITRGSDRSHLARATLNGVALQIRELLEAMSKDLKKKIKPLKVDGGASVNDMLMQYQSDVLGVEVIRSEILETTALGSGLQAGLAIGMWSSLGDIEKNWKASKSFKPKMTPGERKKVADRWAKTMKAVKLLSEA